MGEEKGMGEAEMHRGENGNTPTQKDKQARQSHPAQDGASV
jgi:hypothetical protein